MAQGDLNKTAGEWKTRGRQAATWKTLVCADQLSCHLGLEPVLQAGLPHIYSIYTLLECVKELVLPNQTQEHYRGQKPAAWL